MYYSLVYFRRGSYLDLRRPRCPLCREGDRKWASESLREAKPYLSSSPPSPFCVRGGALVRQRPRFLPFSSAKRRPKRNP